MKARFIGKRTHEYAWIIPGEIYNIEVCKTDNYALCIHVSKITCKYIHSLIPYDSLEAMFDNWDFDVKRKDGLK